MFINFSGGNYLKLVPAFPLGNMASSDDHTTVIVTKIYVEHEFKKD